jgi:hypothetical protein
MKVKVPSKEQISTHWIHEKEIILFTTVLCEIINFKFVSFSFCPKSKRPVIIQRRKFYGDRFES